MDSVSALGVAAAAVQFISFSFEVLELCRQVRDDSDNATTANKQLETAARDLKGIVQSLKSEQHVASQAGKRLSKIAAECLVLSDDLIKLLEDVRGVGSGKRIDAVKATLKALKGNRRIEKLKNALKDKQNLLDSALTHDTRIRVYELAAEQNKQFQTATAATRKLEKRLGQVATQNTRIQQTLLSSKNEVLQSVTAVRGDLSETFSRFQLQDQKDALLESLFYPECRLRKEMIKPPWQRTFAWLFDRTLPSTKATLYRRSKSSSHDSQKWPDFPAWLRHGTSLYWISGKAASGKSTLMGYIINEPTTHQQLSIWAAERPLHVFSFFLWRPGSALQKSVEGLLRSLLYDILVEIPAAAEEALRVFPLTSGQIPLWSERRLRDMLEVILNMDIATQHRFAIFIDGLDEFDGDYDELLQLVFTLHRHAHVKCCISSRPEAQLVESLSSCLELRLGDLNYYDILSFVEGKLDHSGISADFKRELGREISSRAQGVFLWAALTTASIKRGISARDDEDLLRRRLHHTPADMNDLFRRMFESIDEVHARSLGFVLKALVLCQEGRVDFITRTSLPLSIALLAASLSHSDPRNYTKFSQDCQQIDWQVFAQSNGLLEVGKYTYGDAHSEHATQDGSCNASAVPQQDSSDELPPIADIQDQGIWAIRRRWKGKHHSQTARLWEFENTNIGLVHRTAYDFLRGSQDGKPHWLLSQFTEAEVARRLSEATVQLLLALPGCMVNTLRDECMFSVEWRAVRAIESVMAMDTHIGESFRDQALDHILRFIGRCDTEELLSGVEKSMVCMGVRYPRRYLRKYPEIATSLRMTRHLHSCLEAGGMNYVQSIVPEILQRPHPALELSFLLVAPPGRIRREMDMRDLMLYVIAELERVYLCDFSTTAYQKDQTKERSVEFLKPAGVTIEIEMSKNAAIGWRPFEADDSFEGLLEEVVMRALVMSSLRLTEIYGFECRCEYEYDGDQLDLEALHDATLLFGTVIERLLRYADIWGVYIGEEDLLSQVALRDDQHLPAPISIQTSLRSLVWHKLVPIAGEDIPTYELPHGRYYIHEREHECLRSILGEPLERFRVIYKQPEGMRGRVSVIATQELDPRTGEILRARMESAPTPWRTLDPRVSRAMMKDALKYEDNALEPSQQQYATECLRAYAADVEDVSEHIAEYVAYKTFRNIILIFQGPLEFGLKLLSRQHSTPSLVVDMAVGEQRNLGVPDNWHMGSWPIEPDRMPKFLLSHGDSSTDDRNEEHSCAADDLSSDDESSFEVQVFPELPYVIDRRIKRARSWCAPSTSSSRQNIPTDYGANIWRNLERELDTDMVEELEY